MKDYLVVIKMLFILNGLSQYICIRNRTTFNYCTIIIHLNHTWKCAKYSLFLIHQINLLVQGWKRSVCVANGLTFQF